MTKSELVDRITLSFGRLHRNKVEVCTEVIMELMTKTLVNNDRVEIRGFGSFNLHTKKARLARNPKTGVTLQVGEKKIPHFRPGKELKERVNATL